MARNQTQSSITLTFSELKSLVNPPKTSMTRTYLAVGFVSLIASVILNAIAMPFLAHIAYLLFLAGMMSPLVDFKMGCFSIILKAILYPIFALAIFWWVLQVPFILVASLLF